MAVHGHVTLNRYGRSRVWSGRAFVPGDRNWYRGLNVSLSRRLAVSYRARCRNCHCRTDCFERSCPGGSSAPTRGSRHRHGDRRRINLVPGTPFPTPAPGTPAYIAPSRAPLEAAQPTSVVGKSFIDNSTIPAQNYDELIKFTPSLMNLQPAGPVSQQNYGESIRGFQYNQINTTFDGIVAAGRPRAISRRRAPSTSPRTTRLGQRRARAGHRLADRLCHVRRHDRDAVQIPRHHRQHQALWHRRQLLSSFVRHRGRYRRPPGNRRRARASSTCRICRPTPT